MIIIEVKDGESIDRALKRYKNKHRSIKLRNELNSRKTFTKPSVKRREEIKDAIYRAEKFRSEA